ncbi:MAG: DUF6531 domain-containing protein [Oscillospiraceae bacterium]|nr:DUF6531 domain-containing protein [Oscillospiraceae bacterium]
MKSNRSKMMRKLIALVLTLGMVVSAVVPQTLTAHAARIDLSIMDVNVHEERLEIRFWLEYAQYINIAVFYVDGFDEIENRPIRGDRIGYIIKDYFANGSTTLQPMPYNICPAGEPLHHLAGMYIPPELRDMEYRRFTGTLPVPLMNPWDRPGGPIMLRETLLPDEEEEEALEEEPYIPEELEEPEEPENYPADEENGETNETGENGIDNGEIENGNGTESTDNDASGIYEYEEAGEYTVSQSTTGLLGLGTAGTSPFLADIFVSAGDEDGTGAGSANGYGDGAPENGTDPGIGSGNPENGEEPADENGNEEYENGTNGYGTGNETGEPDKEDENGLDEVKEEEEEEELPERLERPEYDFSNVVTNQVRGFSARTVGREELMERFSHRAFGIQPFAAGAWDRDDMGLPILPPTLIEPDFEHEDEGWTTLLWDGSYDRNAGTGLEPDWYPVLTRMDQNWNNILIVIEPIGFPWKNERPECVVINNVYHRDAGANWEWTSKFPYEAGIFFLDGSTWLLAPMGELPRCVLRWLMLYRNGPVTLEELMHRILEGDPINVVTGSFTFSYTDLKLHGEWPLIWERFHNSLDMTNTGLGQGFSHTYDYRLLEERGIVYIRTPYGELVTFFRVFDEATQRDIYRPLRGGDFTLHSDDRNTYEMTFKDGSVFTFVGGLLTNVRTLGGDSIAQLTYEGNRLARVSNRTGHFDITWTGDHITAITDSANRTIRYTYAGDNLVSFENADGDILSYTYDGNGFIATLTDFDGNLFLENTFDERGRVTMQQMHTPGGIAVMTIHYDDSALTGDNVTLACRGVNTVTMFTGEVRRYYYDQALRIIDIIEGRGDRTNTWADNYRANSRYQTGEHGVHYTSFAQSGKPTVAEMQDGAVIRVEHTDCGNRIARITYHDNTYERFTYDGANIASFRDRNGHITNFTYINGLIATITDPMGGVTSFTHDALGRRTSVTDPMGGITRFEHNAAGMVTKVTGPLGDVTTFGYSDAGKLLTITNHAGDTMEFEYTGNGFITSSTDFRGNAEITEYTGLNFVTSVTDREGNVTTFTYTVDGQIATITDFRGGITRFAYNDKGQLISMTDAAGNTTSYAYDPIGRLISITDPMGYVESFTYDVMGRRQTVTDRNGNTTRFLYDLDGRMVREIRAEGTDAEAVTIFGYDPVGNLISVTDANGNITTNAFDRANRLISTTDAEGRVTANTYDLAGRLATITDGEGGITTFGRDLAGNIIREIDPLLNVTHFEFDIMSRLTAHVMPEGGRTAFAYDPNGNVLTITDPVGAVTAFTYDKLNRVVSVTDPLLNVTSHTYLGTFGISETLFPDGYRETFAFNALGLMSSHTNRGGGVTTFTYDSRGQLAQTVDAMGYVTQQTYDPARNLATITRDGVLMLTNIRDAQNRVVETVDPMGTVLLELDPVGNLLSRTDRNGNTTSFEYDKTNLLVRAIDPLDYETAFAYDRASRQVQIVDAGGLITNIVHDRAGNVVEVNEYGDGITSRETFQFDRDRRPVLHTDRNGNLLEFTYDLAGRLIGTETLYVEARLVVKEDFIYDLNGNIIEYVDPRRVSSFFTHNFAGHVLSHTNQMRHTEYYTYCPNFNLTSVQDRSRNVTSYRFDALNRLIEELKPEGERIRFAYDAFHNVIRVYQRQADGEGITRFESGPMGNPIREIAQLGEITEFQTDGEGNIIEVRDADGNVNTFVFDARHMLTEIRNAGMEPAFLAYDAMRNLIHIDEEIGETSFTFDMRNRLTQTTDHNGHTVLYEYDHNNNRTRMVYPSGEEALFEFDHMNRLTALTFGGETKTYQYSPKGQIIKELFPSGLSIEYGYNNAGYLTDTMEVAGGLIRRQMTFTYRENGLLSSRTQEGIDAERREEVVMHTYDRSGRLVRTTVFIEATGSIETRNYAYDIAGNLITETRNGEQISYVYNARNQMVLKTAGSEVTRFEYDRRGNLVRQTSSAGTKTFEFDSANRLVFGENETGETSTYVYNAIGARVFNEQVRDNFNAGHQNGPHFIGSWETSTTLDRILRDERNTWQRIWETNVAGTVVQNDRETVTKHYLPDYTSFALRDIFIYEDGSFVQSFVYDGMRLRPVALILDYAYETQRTGTSPGENPGSDIARNVTTKIWYHGEPLIFSNLFGTDSDGEIRFHMIYDDWGLAQIETRLDMNFHGLDNINNFTGYTFDQVLGIYYAINRFYDANLRRFISEDPIRDGQNWMVYTANNPITYIDPLGLSPSVAQAAAMAEHVYRDIPLSDPHDPDRNRAQRTVEGWRLIDIHSESATQHIGIYIRDGDYWRRPVEFAVVFRGTPVFDGPTWVENMRAYFTDTSHDLTDAIEFAIYFTNKVCAKVTFVGHSKGGGEAIAAAAATNGHAITFNAANFNFEGHELTAGNSIIRNYYVEGDFLYGLIRDASIGTTIWLPTQHWMVNPNYVLPPANPGLLIPGLIKQPIRVPDPVRNHQISAVRRAVEAKYGR